jgi:hypothetical protein
MMLPVLEKRTFEFGYLANGTSQDVVIHPAVDVSNFYRVRIVVRIHSLSIGSGGGKFIFKLQHTLPSESDPQEFTNSSSDFLTMADITSSSPNIQTGTATDPQAFLKIILRATQGSNSGAILYGEFSAVLVLGVN